MKSRALLFAAAAAAAASSGVACHPATPAKAAPPTPTVAAPTQRVVRGLPLPGAGADGVYMDYLAFDPATGRVWVPAGNTGSVNVIDSANDEIHRIEGFPTAEMERHGKKRIVGPSSATVGEGIVYVGNRADNKVCAIDAKTLARAGCATLDSMPDGLAYVAATHEVWVTTPRDSSVTILDVSQAESPKVETKLTFEGQPEGFAVDDQRGVFYTNFEDKDKTLAIDVRSKKTVSTWEPMCGEDGPKGLSLDHALDFLVVACADQVKVLDAGHGGKILSQLATGDGVDDIGYVEGRHELFVGAARAATLTIATLDAQGILTSVVVVPTADGARNAVASTAGVAYLTDTPEGKILVVSPAP